MKMSQAFPSKYLKAEDLGSNRIVVAIDRVEMEEIGDESSKEMKPIVYFQGKEKGLVLNKTNASNIAYLHGDESDMWVGKQIELFTTLVTFGGRQVPAIRIAPPPGGSMESTPMPDGRPTLQNTAGQGGAALDDEVPF